MKRGKIERQLTKDLEDLERRLLTLSPGSYDHQHCAECVVRLRRFLNLPRPMKTYESKLGIMYQY